MSETRMVAVATILVVDDEPRIVQLVRDYLEHGGFTVLTASDGPSALRSARTGRPDLVVLDLGLPGIDGLDVARSLRREGEVPIIMLTARTEESDKLVGLELGADDYLTKPFSPKELVARVRAVLRRAEGMQAPAEVIRVGTDVELDVPRMEARLRAAASTSPGPSFRSSRRWRGSRAGSSRARSCWMRSTASRSSRTSARSTRTSRISARRSSRTRARRATC